MRLLFIKNTVFLTLFLLNSCSNKNGDTNAFAKAEATPTIAQTTSDSLENLTPLPIVVGANRTELYIPLLENKKVGIVTNKSGLLFKTKDHSLVESTHIVDSLLSRNIMVRKVFSPEHGFRGDVDAGEKVKDGRDGKTNLPIISLYGDNKKPTASQLEGIDVLIFDIQDVGVRFYTYISTLTYVMEAAAENNVSVIVLDRPNPNAHYIDGPTLEKPHSSFLGMHEVPLVYGMTIGEYAKMINGELWLKNGVQTDLTVIPLKNWTYTTPYDLPVRPSPNLPTSKSINLYPSLGFFEGTTVNAGRGTEMQFQIFGAPDFPQSKFTYEYTPKPNFGSKSPKHNGIVCHGKDLSTIENMDYVTIEWLKEAYEASENKESFFKTASFTLHAGTEDLQEAIIAGESAQAIHESWKLEVEQFKEIRKKYLMYD